MWIDNDLYNGLKICVPDDWGLEDFVEVDIKDNNFLKIKETLTRVGVSNNKADKSLFQTCHILHKRGRYYIVHFKELFILDGRDNNMKIEDVLRRNHIAQMLEMWGLLKILTPDTVCAYWLTNHEPLMSGFSKTSAEDLDGVLNNLTAMKAFVGHKTKTLKYDDKENWNLVPKYTIGN